MRFSQLVALVLVFGLILSFNVSAKPSWKDPGTSTEKPRGKKNRDTATDTTTTDPVADTTTDTTTSDPVADTTTDTTTSDPVADTTTDTTTTDPVADTTTDTTTTDPVADTTTDTTTTGPVSDTTTDTTTTGPVSDTTTDTTTTGPVSDTTTDTVTEEPVVDTTTEPTILGTATLTWDIPVSRENGDYLDISELDGYKVLIHDTANNTEYFIMITDPTITQWDFAELTPGIWEFSIASIDTQGIYSNYTAVTSKSIN